MPALSGKARDVADWLDRGLLDEAGNELPVGVASSGMYAGAAGAPAAGDAAGAAGTAGVESEDAQSSSLTEQRDQLYATLSREAGLSTAQISALRTVFEHSEFLGQGNPQSTLHPMTREQCWQRRAQVPTVAGHERVCGAKNMVALYDPKREEPEQAKLCIDQYEFPNLVCEYPVTWVRASEAMQICRILGKRLCDAHEWEGACAGELRQPALEYEAFDTRLRAELFHNQRRRIVWATGFQPDARTCATGAMKSPGCVESNWALCGSNTYPAGAFPYCVSPFGVYDLHGNVAEHMNLPLNEKELGYRGGSGETEMKGSWFAFDGLHPHPDDCRWRAPAWHATALSAQNSHFNYHLGFRCCRDLD